MTDMRATPLRPRVLYARFTAIVCLASVAAAAVLIADVRAWETLDYTGMARSSNMVSRSGRMVEEVTSTKKETTCLLPLTPVNPGMETRIAHSSEELELSPS